MLDLHLNSSKIIWKTPGNLELMLKVTQKSGYSMSNPKDLIFQMN